MCICYGYLHTTSFAAQISSFWIALFGNVDTVCNGDGCWGLYKAGLTLSEVIPWYPVWYTLTVHSDSSVSGRKMKYSAIKSFSEMCDILSNSEPIVKMIREMVSMGLVPSQSHKFIFPISQTKIPCWFLLQTELEGGSCGTNSFQPFCQKCSTIHESRFVHLIETRTT